MCMYIYIYTCMYVICRSGEALIKQRFKSGWGQGFKSVWGRAKPVWKFCAKNDNWFPFLVPVALRFKGLF